MESYLVSVAGICYDAPVRNRTNGSGHILAGMSCRHCIQSGCSAVGSSFDRWNRPFSKLVSANACNSVRCGDRMRPQNLPSRPAETQRLVLESSRRLTGTGLVSARRDMVRDHAGSSYLCRTHRVRHCFGHAKPPPQRIQMGIRTGYVRYSFQICRPSVDADL